MFVTSQGKWQSSPHIKWCNPSLIKVSLLNYCEWNYFIFDFGPVQIEFTFWKETLSLTSWSLSQSVPKKLSYRITDDIFPDRFFILYCQRYFSDNKNATSRQYFESCWIFRLSYIYACMMNFIRSLGHAYQFGFIWISHDYYFGMTEYIYIFWMTCLNFIFCMAYMAFVT